MNTVVLRTRRIERVCQPGEPCFVVGDGPIGPLAMSDHAVVEDDERDERRRRWQQPGRVKRADSQCEPSHDQPGRENDEPSIGQAALAFGVNRRPAPTSGESIGIDGVGRPGPFFIHR